MIDEGISKMGGILDMGVELGIISKSGSFYNYKGKVVGQGKEATKSYLKENPKVAQEVEKLVREKAASGKDTPRELDGEKK